MRVGEWDLGGTGGAGVHREAPSSTVGGDLCLKLWNHWGDLGWQGNSHRSSCSGFPTLALRGHHALLWIPHSVLFLGWLPASCHPLSLPLAHDRGLDQVPWTRADISFSHRCDCVPLPFPLPVPPQLNPFGFTHSPLLLCLDCCRSFITSSSQTDHFEIVLSWALF